MYNKINIFNVEKCHYINVNIFTKTYVYIE